MKHVFTAIGLLFFWNPLSHAEQVLVIPLVNRSPSEVIPLVESYFKGRVVLAPYSNNIVARAQPEDIRELKMRIGRVDQKLRAIRISVRTGEKTANQKSILQTISSVEDKTEKILLGPPQSKNSIALRVRTLGSKSVFVYLNGPNENSNKQTPLSLTVSGQLGEWILLPPQPTTHFRAGEQKTSALYAKIDLI